jgi:hypothetical protein
MKVRAFLSKRHGTETRAFSDYYENNHMPLILRLAPTPSVYKWGYIVRRPRRLPPP